VAGSLSLVLRSGRMVAPQLRVLRASPGLVWRAIDVGQAVGAVTAFLRPDDRWFVAFDTCRDDAYGALLAAVAANTGSDLYATVDEGDEHSVELLEIHGFTVARRESMLLIPTDPAITGLRATAEARTRRHPGPVPPPRARPDAALAGVPCAPRARQSRRHRRG